MRMIGDEEQVSFVPMPCVSEDGKIDASVIRTFGEVKKGYTTFAEKDVLFAKITPCMENGKGAIAKGLKNGVGCGSSEFHVLRPVDGIVTSEWLYYLTAWSRFRKEAEKHMTGSAGQRRVPKAYLENYEVHLPSKVIQERQTKILYHLQNIIDHRKNEILRLDELIKARFVEMFANGNHDWQEVSIADICEDTRTGPFGSALHHDEFVDSGVFVLGIDNAVENKFSYNRMRYITDEKYEKLKRYTVYPGDVIITIMGTVGRSAVIPDDMPKAINTKHLACLTPDATIVDSYFLSNVFQIHPVIRGQLERQCKGAIMDGLNLTIIKGLRFELPPLELQKEFVQFFKQVDKSKVV